MLFNSHLFIFIFLPTVFSGYFFLCHRGQRQAAQFWLLAMSLVFYSISGWQNIIIIFISIIFNYWLAQRLENANKRKRLLLACGLGANIFLLAYCRFFQASGEQILIPVGVSFFTVIQIGFLMDCYDGLIQKRSFLNYCIFVTFFPHLLAGPIVHHDKIVKQFEDPDQERLNYKNIAKGLFLFSIGLFKKVVLADNLALGVQSGFSNLEAISFLSSWVTSLSYTMQIYFDFSGYSDMAIAIALLFNISMPVNFNSPYRATSLIEYWRRWHMTLTAFITSYVYTPLVRFFGRPDFYKVMVVTILTFLLVGLWHGLSWHYFIFGALHGVGLVVNHLWRDFAKPLPRLLGWTLTFLYVNMAFIFFRLETVDAALRVVQKMTSVELKSSSWDILQTEMTLAALAMGLILALCFENSQNLIEKAILSKWRQIGLLAALSLAVLMLAKKSSFIYFNF